MEFSIHPEIKKESSEIIKKCLKDYFNGGGKRINLSSGIHVFDDFRINVKDKNNQLINFKIELHLTEFTEFTEGNPNDEFSDIDNDLKNSQFPNFDNPKESHHFYNVESESEEATNYEKEFEKYKNAPHPAFKKAYAHKLIKFGSYNQPNKIKIYVDIHPSASLENINPENFTNDVVAAIEKEINNILKS